MSRWHGNGVANGTAVTAANVNTTGNGDTVTRAASPSTFPTFVYAGDGFEVTNTTATDIARIECALTGKMAVGQEFYTHTLHNIQPFQVRNSTGSILLLSSNVSGNIQISVNGGTLLVSSGPVMALNDRYRIDWLIHIDPSPTTTNGRVVVRLVNLDDNTWNTTGDYYFDSGYTTDVGTADLAVVRYGKLNNGVVSTAARWEQMGWSQPTINPADTSRAATEAYFMSDPYSAVMSAGPDQIDVEPYSTVTLDSSASVGSAARTWTQPSGSPAVTLSSTSATSPTFEAPGTLVGTTLLFRVTDNATGNYDEVSITTLMASRRVKVGGVMVPVKRRVKTA